jgi:hypothetical protein
MPTTEKKLSIKINYETTKSRITVTGRSVCKVFFERWWVCKNRLQKTVEGIYIAFAMRCVSSPKDTEEAKLKINPIKSCDIIPAS